MCRAERFMSGFTTFGKSRQPALLPQSPDPVVPPGQDFVRIGLVADISDQLVMRGVEYGTQRHGQFDHPQR